jgi:hypothetical protein
LSVRHAADLERLTRRVKRQFLSGDCAVAA